MVTSMQDVGRPTVPARSAGSPLDVGALRPRRSPTRLLGGLLLAVLLALVFVWTAQRLDRKQPVLAITRAVDAGQVLSAADLVAVRVAVEPGVPVVPATQMDEVVGHTAAVPLVRGALLAARQVGPAAWPPAGQAEIAVLVKPGHVPTGLRAGASVMVLVTATAAGAGSDPAAVVRAPGRVMGVDPSTDGSGSMTASLLVTRDDGMRLAGSAGEVSLVLLAPQGP